MELNRVLIVDDDPAIRRVVSALLDLDDAAADQDRRQSAPDGFDLG